MRIADWTKHMLKIPRAGIFTTIRGTANTKGWYFNYHTWYYEYQGLVFRPPRLVVSKEGDENSRLLVPYQLVY